MMCALGKRRRRPGARGTAVVEVSLLAPWIFFLFVGVLDYGFYAYALISTENAARAAVMYTASDTSTADDAAGACPYVLGELRELPNVKNAVTSCTASPVQVTAQLIDPGADGLPASRVTVTYDTIQLIPVPGLASRLSITRTVEMRVK